MTPDEAADQGVHDALAIVGAVRSLHLPDVDRATRLDRGRLVAACVALAAMVPDDRTPRDLLAWLHTPTLPLGADEQRQAHAEVERCRTRGEPPSLRALDGERAYQRERMRRRRSTGMSTAVRTERFAHSDEALAAWSA